jgi:hypothetical protein
MRNFVVRVYRSYPEDKRLVSGVVEDIESGQKVIFHNFDDLQSILACSIEDGLVTRTDGLLPE